MITDGSSSSAAPKSSVSYAKKAWSFLKGYTYNVVGCYLEFILPAALVIVFSAADSSHFRDNERVGLMWMRYDNAESELIREQEFPAHQPGSYAHRKRMSVLNANDAAAVVL